MKAAVPRELGQPPRFEDFADPTAGKDEHSSAFLRRL